MDAQNFIGNQLLKNRLTLPHNQVARSFTMPPLNNDVDDPTSSKQKAGWEF